MDYGEEVHWSRSLGERSDTIGYKTGSSSAGGLNYNQDFFVVVGGLQS